MAEVTCCKIGSSDRLQDYGKLVDTWRSLPIMPYFPGDLDDMHFMLSRLPDLYQNVECQIY